MNKITLLLLTFLFAGSTAFSNNDTFFFENDIFTVINKTINDSSILTRTGSQAIPMELVPFINQPTHSHGGGYNPSTNEFWYPTWGTTKINVYDANHQSIRTINSGLGQIMQLWMDLDSGTDYYTANWNLNSFNKFDVNNQIVGSYALAGGEHAGGIATDANFVYVIIYRGNRIDVLDKVTGQFQRSINLPGTQQSHGGLVVANNQIYIAGPADGWSTLPSTFKAVHQLDMDGNYISSIAIPENAYNMAFDGETMWISQYDSTPIGVKISDGNAYGNSAPSDTTAPSAIAQDITVQLNASGNVAITASAVNNGSSDDSGNVTLSLNKTDFDCDDLVGSIANNFALNFDGNDVVNISDASDLRITGDMSIEAWFKVDSTSGDWVRIVGKGASGPRNYGLWYHPSGIWYFQQYGNGASVLINRPINLGEWHHFAATKQGGLAKLFIDGVLIDSANGGTNPATSSDPLTIGYAGFHAYHRGQIDEVRLWDVARTDQQILENYNKMLIGNETGLVAYYNMEEGQGTSLADISNNHSGVLQSFTQTIVWTDSSIDIEENASSGGNQVTLTVTDAAGNFSTATASVTVEDNIDPTITLNGDAIVQHDAFTPYVDQDAVVTDNCSATLVTSDNVNVNVAGSYTVTYTATDSSSNVTVETRSIVVRDITLPTAIAQDITTQLDANGNATITAAQINDNSTDDSGNVTLSLNKMDFDCADLGGASYAIDMNNTNGYISLPDNASLNPTEITMEAWVYSSDWSGQEHPMIISKGVNQEYILWKSDDGGAADEKFAMRIGGSTVYGTTTVQNDTWYHVAGTYDAINGARIYVNGTFESGVGYSVAIPNGNHPIGIGAGFYSSTSTGNYFDGNIDEVRIWNKSLTASEIAARYNQRISNTDALYQNLVLYFPFDAGSGSTAIDHSSFSNDGTFNLIDVTTAWITPDALGTTGGNEVTLTVTDSSGNSSTATANVTVEDNIDPTITLVGAASVNHDAFTAYIDDGATVADNCSATLVTTDNIDVNTFGTYTVTYTATDTGGNETVATRTVIVQDVTNPTAIAQDITVQLDANGNASITPQDIDNGSSDDSGNVTLSLDNTDFDCDDFLVNSSKKALDFDGQNDYLSFSNDISTITDFTYEAWINVKAHNSWSRIFDFGNSPGKNIFLTNSIGNSGIPRFVINTGAGEQQVTSSVTLPLNTWTHIAVTLNGNLATMYIDGEQVGQNTSFLLTPLNLGTTTNNWIGKSQYNDQYFKGSLDEVRIWSAARTEAEIKSNMNHELNFQTSLIAAYHFNEGEIGQDNSHITSVIDSSGNTNNGNFNNFTLNGNTSNWVEGAPLNIGVVTLTVTDATGNSSTATATVTVLDEMLPAITAPADITNVIATSAQGAVVNYTTPVGTDNCSVTTAMTAGLADGSTFPIGITVVTYVATDGSGNIASVSFNVEVVGIAPVIVIPADITVNNDLGECGAIVPFAATDVTGIPNSVISYNIQPNSFFAVGTTIVTASATNASGTSTGTFSVTVSDNEDPVLGTIPSDITVECDAVPTASAADVSATDNCDGSPIVTYLEVRTDGVSVNNYILTRTWTATDVAENSAFKRQEITVEDTTIPVITLVGSNPQIIDINTSYLELSATAIDNCDGDITANIAIDYSAVDLTTIGSYIVTYAVSDAFGNPAVQKTRTVFVLEPGKPWAQDDTYEVAKNSSNNAFRIIENDSYGTDGANADHAISLSGTYTGTGGKLDLEDSTVKYTPRTGYVGADSFSYIITDQNGDASTGYVTINVLELTTPVANTDYVDIIQNSSNNSIDVLANDSFGTDGPASVGSLTVSGTSLEGGSLSINNDKVMYTPLVNFFGDDSFSYTIKDATGETASATVTVNVTEATAVSVPTAEKDVFNVDQNSSNTIMNVLADNGFGVDDFGADGPIDGGLTFTNGLLEGESDRGGVIRITNKSTLSPLDDEILYTPKVGFVGEDGFKYMITDTSGDTSITTVIVTVTEIATPTAVADGITVLEDSGIISIDVLANDSFGSDGPAATDSLVVSSATSTQGSTIAVNSGKIDYTPALGFSGTDTFEYTIKDGTDDDTSTATVTITVEAAGTGNVPTAEDDSVSVTQDSGVNLINILDDNGFGVDFYGSDGPNADHPISLYAFYTDNGGELELDGNVVKYTPRTGYVGIDTFKYTLTDLNGDADVATVTITVEALPLLLTALDDFYTVSQDSGATNLEVLDNDTLLAGASITFFEVVSVHGGAVSLDDNGTVADATDDFLTYTPSSGYSGADSFTYTIGVGVDSSSATVTVTVESAVVVTGVLAAKKDAFTVIQNSIDTAFNVLADNGSGADSYGASGPKDGGLTLINGMLIGATEQGNVTIDAKGTPSPLDDSIVYTPNASYVGVDHFYYMITTVSGNTAIAQVTITVNPATPANGFPTAVDDEVSVLQNSADNSINILDDNGFGIDDYGTDGPHVDHPISLSGTYTDNGGKLELDGTTVKYTPRVGYIGVDQFGYILTDASGDASTAEVTVNVTASAVSTKVGSKSLIKELTVYPNPTKGNLNVLVFSDKTEQVSIVLFDVTGKVIYNKKQELKVGKNTMNLNVNISAGFLFLKVYSNSMDFGTEKVFFN